MAKKTNIAFFWREERGVTMYWLFYVRDHTWSVIFVYALEQD